MPVLKESCWTVSKGCWLVARSMSTLSLLVTLDWSETLLTVPIVLSTLISGILKQVLVQRP